MSITQNLHAMFLWWLIYRNATTTQHRTSPRILWNGDAGGHCRVNHARQQKLSCNPEDGIIIWGFGTGRQDHVLAHGKAEGEGVHYSFFRSFRRKTPAWHQDTQVHTSLALCSGYQEQSAIDVEILRDWGWEHRGPHGARKGSLTNTQNDLQ